MCQCVNVYQVTPANHSLVVTYCRRNSPRLRYQSIHASLLLAVHSANAENRMVSPYVPAYPNISDLHLLVAQNVKPVQNVRWTKLASDRSASLPALDHVRQLPNVGLSTTPQFVPALLALLEIHSVSVKLFVHHPRLQ